MNFDRIDAPEKRRPGRALSLGLLFAAACCVSAVAGNVWNSERPGDNAVAAALRVLERSTDEAERKQAAVRLVDEVIDIVEALQREARGSDAVAASARRGLARLGQLAAGTLPAAPPKEGK